MTALVAIGAIAAVVGAILLGIAIAHHAEQQPKHVAMLIGGMMLTAFGIVIAGFAVVYQSATPLALNAAVPTP
jgi:NADPH-dependent 2,4-dienoyl-CoA reductase/sulfur reductase-like enzyme